MMEKFKAVKNPLTIIALFAGLSEIAFTTSLGLIEKPLQSIFIWFVMGFPTLLIILFFLTLNFNSEVLYSPSDFKEEKNFVKIFFNTKKLGKNLAQVASQLNEMRSQINQLSEDQPDSINKKEQVEIVKIMDNNLQNLTSRLDKIRNEARSVANNFSEINKTLPADQLQILDYLGDMEQPQTLTQIKDSLSFPERDADLILKKLSRKGFVKALHDGSDISFTIDESND